ncbi:uncharacterized protein LOC141801396 [Halichoeres trimaculatus]|uniref:uncharacterized protein LOC141801396 n=1 Tax=Halichoeres trimaculatus TaxID=147232 RepID=UPI003D9F3283
MKIVVALVSLSMVIMVGMVFQAVHQEIKMRKAKNRMVESSLEVKRKEEAIVELKTKIESLGQTIKTTNSKNEELRRKKEEASQSNKNFGERLGTCSNEKAEIVKKKTDLTKIISELKANHEQSKEKASEEIQNLKQQILDRDKAICAFVDTTKEEARKLCGISESSR